MNFCDGGPEYKNGEFGKCVGLFDLNYEAF